MSHQSISRRGQTQVDCGLMACGALWQLGETAGKVERSPGSALHPVVFSKCLPHLDLRLPINRLNSVTSKRPSFTDITLGFHTTTKDMWMEKKTFPELGKPGATM
jgi:hypothetical protein